MLYTTIFSDVDGTIGDKNHNISKENIAAAHRGVNYGLDIILCSGRDPMSLINISKKMGITSNYVIAFNGGTIWESNTKKILLNTVMDKSIALEILNDIQHFQVCIGVYINDNTIIAKNPTEAMLLMVDHNITVADSDFITKINEDIIKIMVIANKGILDIIYNKIYDKIKNRFIMVFTNTHILEFMPISVNKGEGIKWLSNYLNLPLHKAVAFGDNFNDIEMLKLAGMGIAIKNAVMPLKEIADYITKNDNNTSGFAEVIDYVININEANKKKG